MAQHFFRFDDSLPQRIAAETAEMTNYNEIFIPNTFPLNVIYYIFHICTFCRQTRIENGRNGKFYLNIYENCLLHRLSSCPSLDPIVFIFSSDFPRILPKTNSFSSREASLGKCTVSVAWRISLMLSPDWNMERMKWSVLSPGDRNNVNLEV